MTYSFSDEQALGRAYDLTLIRRLIPYLMQQRFLLFVSFAMVPLRAVIELVPALVLAVAVATLTGEASGERLEAVFHVDPQLLCRQVSDMSYRRGDLIAAAEIFADGACLGRGLDDDELSSWSIAH